MSTKRPEDEEPIEAELVDEEIVRARDVSSQPTSTSPSPTGAQPLPEPPRAAPRYRAYRPPKKGFLSFGKMVILLGLVLVAAVFWRKKLTETYEDLRERYFSRAQAKEGDVIKEVSPEPPPKVEPKPVKPGPTEAVKEEPFPTFEKRTVPTLPEEPSPVIPPKERYLGLAYSVIGRKDVSFLDVFQYEIRVVVPADYKKDDLLRMARDIVARERGIRHAVRFYCFKDKVKTKPEDAFAEVIWAPEGNFLKAREAVRKGSGNNEYRVIMKP